MDTLTKTLKGFALIEVIVGVAILVFCIFGIISAEQGFLRLSYQSFQESQANFLLEEGMEIARAFRDESWTNISGLSTSGTKYYLNYSGGKWATSTTPVVLDHVFYRYITVSTVNRDANDDIKSAGVADTGTRKITATVAWKTSMGTTTKSVMEYLTNI